MSDLFTLREIGPADAGFVAALHRALGVAPGRSNQPAPAVRSLLRGVAPGVPAPAVAVVEAWSGDRWWASTVSIQSLGRSAMLVPRPACGDSRATQATSATIGRAHVLVKSRGVLLTQILLDNRATQLDTAVGGAGFTKLTDLIYLHRTTLDFHDSLRPSSPVEWVSYSNSTRSLFIKAITLTYEQSRDCPELSEIRDPDDALAGHQASGVFSPSTWWVATQDGEPRGVMLLNGVPETPVMEVVYMGVAQVARGTDLGEALLVRGLSAAQASSATHVALAVDERNDPARRLYARCGFIEIARRQAWIAT